MVMPDKSVTIIKRLLGESMDITDLMKQVASSNRFALRNLISLYNAFRGDDPQLQGKDAKVAMQAILSAMVKTDPERSGYFGRMSWEPDSLKFAEFLSGIGDQTLAQYLGISSPEDIPVPGGGEDAIGVDAPEGDDDAKSRADGSEDLLGGYGGEEDEEGDPDNDPPEPLS